MQNTLKSTAETVVQIVHGSSAPLTDFIFAAVVDTQDVFGKVGHHTKEGDDPHPEDRSGTAGDDGCRDTCDITCADRRCQRRAQTLELTDGLIVFCRVGRYVAVCKHSSDSLGKPVPDVRDLEESGQKSHQNTGADQKDQHGKSPYKPVYRTVDVCDLFNGSDGCHTVACRQ